jgi:hypothetical protein
MTPRGRSILCPRHYFDAAQSRHPDVQDERVGVVFLAETHCLQSVAGVSDHRQASGLEQTE